MHFLQWFARYGRWSTVGWLVLISVGAAFEILGFVRKDGTTFTDLVRSTVPIPLRVAVLVLLIWHFCIAKTNWQ